MKYTKLDNEHLEEYKRCFSYKRISNDKFFLTYYNGNLYQFCQFLVYLLRKEHPNIDKFSNSRKFTISAFTKDKGIYAPNGIYSGTWMSGVTYLFTHREEGDGTDFDDYLYLSVQSEQDAIDKAMDQINEAISSVKSDWGTERLKESLFRKIMDGCTLG